MLGDALSVPELIPAATLTIGAQQNKDPEGKP